MNKNTEHYIEEIIDYNIVLEHAISIEEIQFWLKVKSGNYFVDGKDEIAVFLRNLSEEIGDKAKSWRKKIDEENLKNRNNDAWTLLGEVIDGELYPENKKYYKDKE
jgi:hypothetical protein